MVRGNPGKDRRRLSGDELMARKRDIIARHRAGDSPRVIEKATGVPRMTCWRIIAAWEKAQVRDDSDDDDDDRVVDGFREVNVNAFDALPLGVRRAHELKVCLADLEDDPANPLALFRLGHISGGV